MVDGRERQPTRPRERLRRRDSNEQRADEAWALRDCDAIEVVECHTGFGECFAHDRRDELEMTPRGDLGNNAAERCVQLGLRRDDVALDLPVGCDDGCGGFVAARLDAKDQAIGSFHMMSASSRLSV